MESLAQFLLIYFGFYEAERSSLGGVYGDLISGSGLYDSLPNFGGQWRIFHNKEKNLQFI